MPPNKPSFRPTESTKRVTPSGALMLPGAQEVNNSLRELFAMENVQSLSPEQFDTTAFYADEPSDTSMINVGERSFGVEMYAPESTSGREIWLVTQHGYGGNPSDWSRLASILKRDGIGIASLGMHVNGKDDFEVMSMSINEWASVAVQAPKLIAQLRDKELIFVGQSSGGSSGAAMLTKGKSIHPYKAALLIGPTLITPISEELVAEMDRRISAIIVEQRDVMLDWSWFTHAIHQMHNEDLNHAYQAYCTTLPGYPLRAARECAVIPRKVIIDKLSAIDVPTMLVKGTEDDVDTESLQAVLNSLAGKPNPHIQFAAEPENTGHQMHIENPEATAVLVRGLIADLED